MSYALGAKQCLEFVPDGDNGPIIQSNTTIFGPAGYRSITVELEIRPYYHDVGRSVLFNWMEYDPFGSAVVGVDIQRWKTDLDIAIAGSLGQQGFLGLGPIFFYDDERCFLRICVQTQPATPRVRVIIWRDGNLLVVTGWVNNKALEFPTSEPWTFMRRREVVPGFDKYPFHGRLYQAAVAKQFVNHPGVPMKMDGYEFNAPQWFSIYGLKEGSGDAVIDTTGREHCTVYDDITGQWQWIPELWYHDTDYAGQHPADYERLDLLEKITE